MLSRLVPLTVLARAFFAGRLFTPHLYQSPWMGGMGTLVVYIDMIFLRLRRVVFPSPGIKFGCDSEARSANCTLLMIRLFVAKLVVWSFIHSAPAYAANPDLENVLAGSRNRIEKLDYRATGRLTKVEVDGKRTSYKFLGKARWFPDGLRVLCEVSGPGGEKTTILLHMTANGRVTIEAQLPGEQAAKVLPFEHWNDLLVGTDFSYEDMVENQFFWKSQQLLAPEKYGARDCFVLKSAPGPQDRSYYDSATSWIDRSILFPVRVVKTVHGTGQQKEFLSYALRQVAGAWSASQVEVKVVGKPGSSMLAIEGGSGKATLTLKDFDLGQSDGTEKSK